MSATPGDGITVSVRGAQRGFASGTVVRIGRDAENDIVIDNPHVSRKHATLSLEGTSWVLQSVGDPNLFQGGSAVARVMVTGPTDVTLAAPPDGERITLTPAAPAGEVTRMSPSVDIPGGQPTGGVDVPPTAAAVTPGGPLQRSGGITVRLNGRQMHFDEGKDVTIGRLPSSDVLSENELVSREHARLTSDRGSWTFQSMGQRGSFQNGAAVTTLVLTQATTLRLGDPAQGDQLELVPDTVVAPTALPPGAAAPAAAAAGAGAAGAGAAMPGGAMAANQTGNTSMIRRLATTNRRSLIVAIVAVVAAVALGVTAVVVAGNNNGSGEGSGSMQAQIQGARAKTAWILSTSANGTPLSSGTGWVYSSSQGLIVTNSHVVEDGSAYQIGINNQQVNATLRGIAPCYDLSVLQTTMTGLPQFTLANQSTVKDSDPVGTLGYPVNFSLTEANFGVFSAHPLQTAEGTVSTVNTSATGDELGGYPSLIQTTATINHGNSGGPLIDAQGRLIGVNTLADPESSNQFYAIPADQVEKVGPTLSKGISLGYDGIGPRHVSVIHLSGQLQAGQNLPNQLLAVTAIRPNSPAAVIPTAGKGLVWVIRGINGTPVSDPTSYCNAIRDIPSGQTATYGMQLFQLSNNRISSVARKAYQIAFANPTPA